MEDCYSDSKSEGSDTHRSSAGSSGVQMNHLSMVEDEERKDIMEKNNSVKKTAIELESQNLADKFLVKL